MNLEDLEMTIGDEQHLWLLQIQAIRSERALRAANPNSEHGRGPSGGSNAYSSGGGRAYFFSRISPAVVAGDMSFQ